MDERHYATRGDQGALTPSLLGQALVAGHSLCDLAHMWEPAMRARARESPRLAPRPPAAAHGVADHHSS